MLPTDVATDPLILPETVRYVKNGEGGQWWAAARADSQIHLGWSSVPAELLASGDLAAIERHRREEYEANGKLGLTQDINAIRMFLDRPSQYLWITFQDGCLWWCTVRDGISVSSAGKTRDRGHFWLHCDRPWSSYSLGGRRHLVMAELPGVLTTTAGFQGTVCEPAGWREALRIIRNEEDPDALAMILAREAYEAAVAKLIARLRPRDFEVLVDLVLARSGWARLAKLGGAVEGVDLEVENAATDEIAFVQVKSRAGQAALDDYVARFDARRDRYDRMIFVVHSPAENLEPPPGGTVMVWVRTDIAKRAVKLGLGDWIAKRV